MRATLLLSVLLFSNPAAAQRFGLFVGGDALQLVRFDVQLEVHHPVAETTLTQEFENPHPTDQEATFYYPVPSGAVVTGLALWVKGERRPARLLERGRAVQIYEGIVRQRRDPALLERLDGNTFRIRVFPVVARSRARIELRFVQPVEAVAGNDYRVTLRRPAGAPIDVLRLGVSLRAPFAPERPRLLGVSGELRQEREGWSLPATASTQRFADDIHLRYGGSPAFQGPALAAASLDGERLFVAEVPLPSGRQRPQRLALLLDSSRSMEPHLALVRALGNALLGRLSPIDRVALVPFGLLARGQEPLLAAVPEQRLRWRGQLNELRASGGASFLPAVRAARAAGAQHVVLCTDGGSLYHAAELEQLLRELVDRPGLQVSTIALSGAQNEEQLRAIALQTGGVHARVESARELEVLAVRLLESRGRPGVELGRGQALLLAEWPGRLLLAGRVPEADAEGVTLRLHTGEAYRFALPASSGGTAVSALLGSAAIEERMGRVRLFGETPELRRQIVRLSLRHGVVSEYTALLATETDADYDRPTSGEPWQRRLPRVADDLPPSFQSTPEPHEIALLVLALLILGARRRFAGRLSRARG